MEKDKDWVYMLLLLVSCIFLGYFGGWNDAKDFYEVKDVMVESIGVNPLLEPVKALNREFRVDSLSFYDVAVCLRGESVGYDSYE